MSAAVLKKFNMPFKKRKKKWGLGVGLAATSLKGMLKAV
jgi:hypothetical protein